MKIAVKRKRMVKRERTKNIFVASILFYPLLLFCVFWIGTNINSILLAFRMIDVTREGWVYGWTFLGNFKEFIGNMITEGGTVRISMTNSLKFYIITFIITNPLQIIFAYLLFKKCFMNGTIRFVVLMPTFVSTFIYVLLFRNMISYNGPFVAVFAKMNMVFPDLLMHENYAFSTLLSFSIWLSFSSSLIIYPNVMKEIPGEIIESAQVDGIKNMWQELRYIILPLIYPTISMFIIIGFPGILLAGGPLLEFYKYDAPLHVYSMGYWFTHKTMVEGELSYPIMAAGGLLMTLTLAPLTHLLKHLLDKYGPTTE